MKIFVVALLLVCAALTMGVMAGNYIADFINGQPEPAHLNKQCPATLKSLLSGEDKPTVCR